MSKTAASPTAIAPTISSRNILVASATSSTSLCGSVQGGVLARKSDEAISTVASNCTLEIASPSLAITKDTVHVIQQRTPLQFLAYIIPFIIDER